MRCFARFFQSGEDFETFIQGLLNEQRLRKRIEQLQQYRMMGIKTLAEAEKIEEIRKRQALQQDYKYTAKKRGFEDSESEITSMLKKQNSMHLSDPVASKAPLLTPAKSFDVDSLPGVEFLSSKEKQLCSTLQLFPTHYLQIKEKLIRECYARGYIKEGQARQLIKIDINKTDKIFDFFISAR